MAQQASRASVELYTHLFFKNKTLKEEAYVIRVLKNGIVVLVPKYGVEGIVYSSANPDEPSLLIHDSRNNRLVSLDNSIEIKLFQKVTIQITVAEAGESSAQRSKLQLKLLNPIIPSAPPVTSVKEKPKRRKMK